MSEWTLTEEEEEAIRQLQELAARWPGSLWLFAAGNALHVMRYGSDGKPALTGRNDRGGFDPDYVVESIELPIDGGDW